MHEENIVKKWIKRKVTFTQSLMVAFLITGGFGLVSQEAFGGYNNNIFSPFTPTGNWNASFIDGAGKGTTGDGNFAAGFNAGQNVAGSRNITLGVNSGQGVKGSTNFAAGDSAGNNVTGNWNTAIGREAGQNVAGGTDNVALGFAAGKGVTGTHNFSVMNTAGQNVSGMHNTSIGRGAGTGTSGNHNVSLGELAGVNRKGDQNISLGFSSGKDSAGWFNVAIGNETGQNVGNTKPNLESTNETTGMGRNNVAIGRKAGNDVQGNENVAIGARVGEGVGSTSTHSANGIQNVALGSDTGNRVQGSGNVSLGIQSGNDITGSNNFTVGHGSGNKVSGNDNIIMGKNAAQGLAGIKANETISIGTDSLASKDNVTAVGHGAKATEEKTLALGGNATANIANSVALGNDSTTTVAGATTKAADNTYTTETINGATPLTLNFAGGDNVAGVVSVGSTTGTRRIQNVSAGLLSKESTDAVNGSQLYSLAEKVANISVAAGKTVKVVAGKNVVVNDDNTTNPQEMKYTINAEKTTVTAGAGLKLASTTAATKDNNYVNTYELALDDKILADLKAANPDTYFHVNDGTATGGNAATNNGKIGEAAGATKKNSLAAGVNAGASAEGATAIGYGAKAVLNNSVAMGSGARVTPEGGAGTDGIAIGTNARSHVMTNGNHEALITFGRAKDTLVGGIAIGKDTHARIGNTEIGNRDYRGQIGDFDFSTSDGKVGGTAIANNGKLDNWDITSGIGSTVVGDNSFAMGNFQSINGSYNIISKATDKSTANWAGDIITRGTNALHNAGAALQGFGATINGSLNAIEGNENITGNPFAVLFGALHPASGLMYSGLASSIVGTANRINKSNGALIFGTGNEITNSYLTPDSPIIMDKLSLNTGFLGTLKLDPTISTNSIKELSDTLRKYSQDNRLASVGIMGGANKVDYALFSNVNGVGNELKGKGGATLNDGNTEYDKTKKTVAPIFSAFNSITGYENKGTNVVHSVITGSWNTLENTEKNIVIGNNHILKGTNADKSEGNIILGFHNDKKVLDSIKESVDNVVSIGNDTKVGGNNAIAIGKGAEANNDNTISIGTGNKVNAANSGAIGDPNVVLGENSYVIGNNNTLNPAARNTFVLGNDVTGTTENSVVLGNKSSGTETATTETEATLGKLTYGTFVGAPKSEGHYVSVGAKDDERQIKNVAAGKVSSDSTDAINGSQLHATNQILSNVAEDTVAAIGGNAKLEKDGNITVSNIANTGKSNINDAIIAARTTVKSTDGTVKVGEKEENGAFTYDLSVDTSNLATKQELKDAKTEIKAGENVNIKKDDTKTNNVYTINALDTTVEAGDGAVTVTGGTVNNYDKTYKINVAKVTAKPNGPITVTGGTVENGVLKDYEIAFDESQLSKTTVKAADDSIHIEDVGTNGNHEYKIKAKTAAVVDGVNTKVTSTVNGMNTEYKVDVAGDLSDISSISNGTTKVSLNKDENKVNVNGAKITNVANGEVSSTSKEAVNGSQLHAVKEQINNTHADIHHLNNKVDKLDGKVNKGLANAAAMAGIEFMEIGVNQGTIAAAVGGYKGTQAVAVGLQSAPTENTRVHAKVSVTPGSKTETMYSVGAAYRFNWK